MYRANRWTTTASKAIRGSNRTADRILLRNEKKVQDTFARTNVAAAGRGGFHALKFAVSGVIATGVAIGSAIFYAGRNDKIRDDFENKVPFVKPVLSSIYGEREAPVVESEVVGDEFESLLPLNKSGDFINEVTESVLTEDQLQESHHAEETLVEEEKEVEVVENPARNDVVVITTIDDQAAVSSVDLDISNANSRKEKKIKKKKEPKVKKTKEKKKKDAEEEKKEEAVVEPSNELVAITASGITAAEIISQEAPTDETVSESVEASSTEAAPKEILEQELSTDEIARVSELVDQRAMEVLLQTYVGKLQIMHDNAVQKYTAATEQLQQYTSQLEKALAVEETGEAFDTEWKAASDLEHASQEIMDEAKDAEHKLQENIEAIYEMIKSVRKSGPSELADLAQDAATKASLDLIKVTEDVKQSSEVLVKMAKEYMVNKDAMKEELIMTSPSEELPVHEQENEGQAPLPFKDVLLTYAMKKVELLKQEMDKARAEGERKLEEALQVERRDGEKKTHAQLQMQEERIKREYEVILQKREADLLEEFENEIRKQLKRQSAAHRDHLTDMLQTQGEKLAAEHKDKLDGELTRQRVVHSDEMAKIVSHLRGVESMIDSVVDVEKRNRNSRELWLAVQSLGSVLSEDLHSGRTKDLMPEISAIAKLADNNETVQFVLGTIPEIAIVDGVCTEEGLKSRFANVKSICKRVAMVGDNVSLWTYLLSTVRSFLVFETQAKRDITNDVDPEALTPYEVLAKAQNCIDSGDLELAVKFMSLLKGLPRKLASDWLRESRAYLETKQASDFLLAFVASENADDFKE